MISLILWGQLTFGGMDQKLYALGVSYATREWEPRCDLTTLLEVVRDIAPLLNINPTNPMLRTRYDTSLEGKSMAEALRLAADELDKNEGKKDRLRAVLATCMAEGR